MKMMKLFIGRNDKDTLQQKYLKSNLLVLLDYMFENYIIQDACSRFTNNEGTTIDEASFIVYVVVADTMKIDDYKPVIDTLKLNLNQECILVELDNEVKFL